MFSHTKFRLIKDKILLAIIIILAVLPMVFLLNIFINVSINGIYAILKSSILFFISPPAFPGADKLGGIGPAIIGSLVMVALASLIAIPLGSLTAVYMVEYPKSILSRVCFKTLHALIEFPTIVVSLFIFTTIVTYMGSPSAFAGSLSLTIIMLPYVTIQVREALLNVPFTYKEAGYSLCLSRVKIIFHILFGIARRGILAGILLGVMRAFGDTASILFTAGAAMHSFYGLFGPASAIPLLIFKFAQSPYENWRQLAYGASFLLIMLSTISIIILRKLIRGVKI